MKVEKRGKLFVYLCSRYGSHDVPKPAIVYNHVTADTAQPISALYLLDSHDYEFILKTMWRVRKRVLIYFQDEGEKQFANCKEN